MAKFVVVEMDSGHSGDEVYVSQVFGLFNSEKEADDWIKKVRMLTKGYRDLSTREIIPVT